MYGSPYTCPKSQVAPPKSHDSGKLRLQKLGQIRFGRHYSCHSKFSVHSFWFSFLASAKWSWAFGDKFMKS